MKPIQTLFDRMDSWRHLPNYQLERRADLFFSLYLPEILQAKLGFPVSDQIIPEFPVRIGTIYPNIPTDKSYKIDYVLLSADAKKAVLVELKTEGLSPRDQQDKYLLACREVGFAALVSGVFDIFRATNSKRKYYALLELMESMGLIRIPIKMKEIMSRSSLQGVSETSYKIKNTTSVTDSLIVYIQPNGVGNNTINFEEFNTTVKRYNDPISMRFAESIQKWAKIKAGHK